MKFVKGMVMGTLISAGAMWMYRENMGMDSKKIIKKGKKIAKKMGIM